MNDYWNDPPEIDEPPEHCGEPMDVDEDGECHCRLCGMIYRAPAQPEPPDTVLDDEVSYIPVLHASRCSHGRPYGDCARCEHDADLAVDAHRERRLR